MDSGDLNSGPHAYAISTLPTEPSPSPGFLLTVSHYGAGKPLTHTCLALAAFLSWGKVYNPSVISLTLKLEPSGQSCQVLLLDGVETWPPVQLHLHQLSIVDSFLHCCSFSLVFFTRWKFSWMRSYRGHINFGRNKTSACNKSLCSLTDHLHSLSFCPNPPFIL